MTSLGRVSLGKASRSPSVSSVRFEEPNGLLKNIPMESYGSFEDRFNQQRRRISTSSVGSYSKPFLEQHEIEANYRRRLLERPKGNTLGERVADAVANNLGSWTFIIVQSILLAIWIGLNYISKIAWDPYPFILMNLALSFQAAFTAPIIMMSQNRADNVDRIRDSDLHEKIDQIRILEVHRIWQKIEEQDEVIRKIQTLMDELDAADKRSADKSAADRSRNNRSSSSRRQHRNEDECYDKETEESSGYYSSDK